jgi:type IV secretory pathway VirB9-like protein
MLILHRAYLLRLYNDETPLIDHSNIIYNKKLAAKQQQEEQEQEQENARKAEAAAEGGQTSSEDE